MTRFQRKAAGPLALALAFTPLSFAQTTSRTLSLDDLGEPRAEGAPGFDPSAPGENLRIGFDAGVRFSAHTAESHADGLAFAGIDALKVFSGPTGDWGTLKLQIFALRIDDFESHAFYHEDDDDWELLWKDVNFTYTALGPMLHVKAGHFYLPFGLQSTNDTNLTLRQFSNESNLGICRDWGVMLGGEHPRFEYEASLTRGTGNEYSSRGDPWVFAARVGTPREANVVLGTSIFIADLQGVPAQAVSRDIIEHRWRIGADAQWHSGPFSVLAEGSWGENETEQFMDLLAEIDWHDPSAQWYLYLQGRYQEREYAHMPMNRSLVYFGVKYVPSPRWSYSFQYKQYLDRFYEDRYGDDGVATFQIRHRF